MAKVQPSRFCIQQLVLKSVSEFRFNWRSIAIKMHFFWPYIEFGNLEKGGVCFLKRKNID